ncbi:PREDICTED: uncharacterized protein LOC109221251 [Nicotiana attenuata]|uniref:uncharacterized protein LOC109221251 n=1 Tax=Nicotiana attenuata TaxID=49451 RepID=UPI0009050701|nr:PREDICTED: uncharacterized protein LOC109221251 [Nicotiana attenuata]
MADPGVNHEIDKGTIDSATNLTQSVELDSRIPKYDSGKNKSLGTCIASTSSVSPMVQSQPNTHADENLQKLKANKDSTASEWVNLFANNRIASNGIALSYIAPTIVDGNVVIQLDPVETAKEVEKWKHSLIVAVLGEIPGYNQMKRYINHNWSKASWSELFWHEKGYFIAKFKEEDDLKEVLYGGPYTINNRPIILKKWSLDVEFDTAFLKEIPLWVSFPNLPMAYWGKESLSRLGSAIGVPLFADECTANQSRISFARMLIEVNITKPLPTGVTIQDPSGKMYKQVVRFEWQPEFCSDCQQLGHICKRNEEVQGRPQNIQKVYGKAHQPAKEWRSKGSIQQNTSKELTKPNTNSNSAETVSPIAQVAPTVFHNIIAGKSVDTAQGMTHAKRHENSVLRDKNSVLTPRTNVGDTDFSIITKNTFEVLSGGPGGRQPPDRGGTSVNGRIWLLVDSNIWQVDVIQTDAQFIHCIISNSSIRCAMTVVYGYNSLEKRKEMWQKLQSLAQTINYPWLLWGDFNAIISTQDRVSKVAPTQADIQDFANFCSDTMLIEIPWRGEFFTWTNGQMGEDRVVSRLDRALGNDEWMMNFDHLTVEIGDPFISDHSPLTLKFHRRNNSIRVPFRLKAMKPVFKDLNNKNFRNIIEKINQARRELIEYQQEMNRNYSDQLRMMEKEAIFQLEKWSSIKEKILQQKSRAHWINVGDGNNKYFFAMLKDRTSRKNIHTLTALNGEILTDPKRIKKEIVDFYRALMGTAATTLPAVNMQILKKGPQLNHQQIVELTKDISKHEVNECMHAIGNDKAPGIDDYNVVFFKKA